MNRRALATAALQTFRASRVEVDDLGLSFWYASRIDGAAELVGVAGYVYLGSLSIEREEEPGWFRLVLPHVSYRSGDLASLEVLLCAWTLENELGQLVNEREIAAEARP